VRAPSFERGALGGLILGPIVDTSHALDPMAQHGLHDVGIGEAEFIHGRADCPPQIMDPPMILEGGEVINIALRIAPVRHGDVARPGKHEIVLAMRGRL